MKSSNPQLYFNNIKGFSLIEIMVVIVIIGLFAGSAVLIFDSNNSANQLKRESQRLKQIIKIAMDESLINATQLGLVITEEGYEFLQLKDRNWIPVSDDKSLAVHHWPKNTEVFLQLEGLAGDNDEEGFLGEFSLSDSFAAKLERDRKKESLLELDSNPNFAEITDEQQQQDAKVSPQIYILSSGEITPFNLLLMLPDEEQETWYQLSSDVIGNIEVDGPYEEKPQPGDAKTNRQSYLLLNNLFPNHWFVNPLSKPSFS